MVGRVSNRLSINPKVSLPAPTVGELAVARGEAGGDLTLTAVATRRGTEMIQRPFRHLLQLIQSVRGGPVKAITIGSNLLRIKS